jgi:hypothetical protein
MSTLVECADVDIIKQAVDSLKKDAKGKAISTQVFESEKATIEQCFQNHTAEVWTLGRELISGYQSTGTDFEVKIKQIIDDVSNIPALQLDASGNWSKHTSPSYVDSIGDLEGISASIFLITDRDMFCFFRKTVQDLGNQEVPGFDFKTHFLFSIATNVNQDGNNQIQPAIDLFWCRRDFQNSRTDLFFRVVDTTGDDGNGSTTFGLSAINYDFSICDMPIEIRASNGNSPPVSWVILDNSDLNWSDYGAVVSKNNLFAFRQLANAYTESIPDT